MYYKDYVVCDPFTYMRLKIQDILKRFQVFCFTSGEKKILHSRLAKKNICGIILTLIV